MADADIFLILLRPTRVPVVGEAVSNLFQGQVLIESLTWKLHNEDERKRAAALDDEFQKQQKLVNESGSLELRTRHAAEDMERANRRNERRYEKSVREAGNDNDERDRAYKAYKREHEDIYETYKSAFNEAVGIESAKTRRELAEDERRADIAEADRNKNFEFTFTKRVDIASTQMLNSMKAGDIFPSATLTIHKRSASVADGTSLVFTIQKVRLLNYQLQVVVTDTMTEMMEEWTCEFAALAYVYKNPPSHSSNSGAGQAAIKAATQGTTRAFTMKNIGSPI